MERLEWLIVGGGIHGVHHAVRLLGEAGVQPRALRLVDPGIELLDTWRRCTANTGMRYLRSPAVHHLDVDPWSLHRFAGTSARGRGKRAKGLYRAPYDRPAVSLFARHCDALVQRYGLHDLHLRERVVDLNLACDGARVQLDSGQVVEAERVLLAMGASAQPRWPAWAQALQRDGAFVRHVFRVDKSFQNDFR